MGDNSGPAFRAAWQRNTCLFASLFPPVYPYLEWVAINPWSKRRTGENRGQGFDCQLAAPPAAAGSAPVRDRKLPSPVHPNYTTFSRSLLNPGEARKGLGPPRLRGLALHPGDPLRSAAAAPGSPPHGAGDTGLPEERLARRRHREDEMSGLQRDLGAGTATIGSIPWQEGNDSPTKLDKIKSLRAEVQAITLAGGDGVSYTPRMLGVDRSIACGLAKGLITFLPAPATHQFSTRYTGRRKAQSQPRPWRLPEHRDA